MSNLELSDSLEPGSAPPQSVDWSSAVASDIYRPSQVSDRADNTQSSAQPGSEPKSENVSASSSNVIESEFDGENPFELFDSTAANKKDPVKSVDLTTKSKTDSSQSNSGGGNFLRRETIFPASSEVSNRSRPIDHKNQK
ncbi:MAG: hypothetical protein K2Z81_16870 [Cyanobacteria bacterium]|nr:hypothetical protein [Cyanobacteriota bacterium]